MTEVELFNVIVATSKRCALCQYPHEFHDSIEGQNADGTPHKRRLLCGELYNALLTLGIEPRERYPHLEAY